MGYSVASPNPTFLARKCRSRMQWLWYMASSDNILGSEETRVRAICLCAGRSSRLLPLTLQIHKSALHVAGWPVLDWQISAFLAAGIKEVVFVLGHGAYEIRRLLEPWRSVLEVH